MPKNTIDIYDNVEQIAANTLRDNGVVYYDVIAKRIAHDVVSFLDEAPVTVLHPGDDRIDGALFVAADHLHDIDQNETATATIAADFDGSVTVTLSTTVRANG